MRKGLGTAVSRTRTVNGVSTRIDDAASPPCAATSAATPAAAAAAPCCTRSSTCSTHRRRPRTGPPDRGTVMVGSANLTATATRKQWNNMLTVRQQRDAARAVRQDLRHHEAQQPDGGPSTSAPARTPRSSGRAAAPTRRWRAQHDPLQRRLGRRGLPRPHHHLHQHARLVRHPWLRPRQEDASLHDRGCYVRVLYSFMSYSVFKKLQGRDQVADDGAAHAVLDRR